jgi:hypothetical protein
LDVNKNDWTDVTCQQACFCKIDDSFFSTNLSAIHQATMTAPTPSNHNTAAANNTTTPLRALPQLALICEYSHHINLLHLQQAAPGPTYYCVDTTVRHTKNSADRHFRDGTTSTNNSTPCPID